MSKKQDEFYFNNFIECVQYAGKAARMLESIMSDFNADDLQKHIDEIHKIEHAADLKKHELTEVLAKAFITPIEREDIVLISRNIDTLVDKIEDVLIKIYCNGATKIRPDANTMLQIIIKCCDKVSVLMEDFADFKHSKNIKEHIIVINTLEEEADKIYIDCMHRLHTESTDLREIIAWHDIYTVLEKCADAAESIADIVEEVIMKNC